MTLCFSTAIHDLPSLIIQLHFFVIILYQLIQAFINTRLDYCNSLYFGIADSLMSRLQSVQNAATYVSSPESGGASTSDASHTSAALAATASLQTSDFKISTLVYRSLAGIAPVYLADKITLVTAAGRRPLRSADNRTW